LRRFYPELLPAPSSQAVPIGTGKVFITANRDGADIFVDGKFVGSTPSTFTLPVGPHTIEVKGQDGTIWKRVLEVLKDSEVKLNAILAISLENTASRFFKAGALRIHHS
jgi:hypothetical protein